jgi:putative NAD(P)-binding protein
VLIVGCGCRGRALARRLAAEGYAVRGTTRHREGAAAIAATGAEPWVGDPARLATLSHALEAVTVVCWLLASAHGNGDQVAALHQERLRSYLHHLVDTTVRGFVYETAGTADPRVLECGRAIVEEAEATWELATILLDADPGDPGAWVEAARDSVAALVGDRAARPRVALGLDSPAVKRPQIRPCFRRRSRG